MTQTNEITAEQVKQWYVDLNGQEKADEEPFAVYEATAHYLNMYDYGDEEVPEDDREIFALAAYDVLRLAYGGEFFPYGIDRTEQSDTKI